MQQESLRHMAAQRWLYEGDFDLDTIFSSEFIRDIHRCFYQEIPEILWLIRDKSGDAVDKIVPGEWRIRTVDVGQHLPPDANDISDLMDAFCDKYHLKNYKGDR